MQLAYAGRCRVTRRPSPGPRRRSPPATSRQPRWHCCITRRGRGTGLWRRWSPTPRRCACTIAGRARCSRSAPPTWRPCTLAHRVATGATRCTSKGPWQARPRHASAGRAEEMPSAWLWRRTWGRGSGRSPRPGGRLRATGRSSLTRGAAGWRSSFPWGECCTCRSHQACHQYGLRHPRPRQRGRPRKRRPSRRPRGAPRLSMAPMPTFGTCCSTSVVTWPRISVEQRRSMSAPGLG